MAASPTPVTALLGPTNTGKTHAAIQRMLGHPTGMIGLPLRLLAREVYDKVVERIGAEAVALLTGEEKIVPGKPRYFVCTVEAMPLDEAVAFVAVDEIQLAADRQRGHIFTDRILHARGTAETMLLGADTMAPLLQRLLPEVTIERHPRLSALQHAGYRPLDALPRRSAVIAFSAEQVYRQAEALRARHGGTAVVLGALSPRTRNAQVAMFQAGEVKSIVATDAIGMGLNLDLRHVAFAGLQKFDGHELRRLTPAEIGQVAGRAGRYRRNGTFGTTAEAPPLPPELVTIVESHDFVAVRKLWFRNRDLDFSSLQRLIDTLGARPPRRRQSARESDRGPFLLKADAEDHQALAALARRDDIRKLARGRERIALLWEVCQVPDFRDSVTEAHLDLLDTVFRGLAGGGALDADLVAGRVGRLDRTVGDIDTLTRRIAWIRTWTFIAHKPGWLPEARHWQERTRDIEDRLSDALHEQLTRRFVDRRVAAEFGPAELDLDSLHADDGGVVTLDDDVLGRLDGLVYVPEPGPLRGGRRLDRAVRQALRPLVAERVAELASAPHGELGLDCEGRLCWRGTRLAQLVAGSTPLDPVARPGSLPLLDAEERERVRGRVTRWLTDALAILRLQEADDLAAPGRGIVFQVQQGLGTVPTRQVSSLVAALSKTERRALARLDVRLGREVVYVLALLEPEVVALRAALWAVHTGRPCPEPPTGPAVRRDPAVPAEQYRHAGYPVRGSLAVRADVLEVLAARVRAAASEGPFVPSSDVAALLGAHHNALPSVLRGLGYRSQRGRDGVERFNVPSPERRGKERARPRRAMPRAPRDTDW